MAATPADIELSKYWSMLSPAQKNSLLEVIKSFIESPKIITQEQYNQELSEAEAEYQAGDYITSEEMLKLLRKW